jgi:hypothetical protein
MPTNLTLRIHHAGQVLITRNRKLSQPWRWARVVVVAAVVLATAGVLCTSLFWAWADLQYITHSYEITQALETQKHLLDLNRKLKIELANLTAIARLEELAAEYGMGTPQPGQVINLQ